MQGVCLQDALEPASPDVLLSRRLRTRLVTLGGAIIALSLWTMAKTVIIVQQYPDELKIVMQSMGMSSSLLMPITIAIAVAGTAFECYVGYAARMEGNGRPRTVVYLVIAVVVAIFYALGVAGDFMMLAGGGESISDIIANVGIDLTGFMTVLVLVITAIRVRRLTRQVES